MHTSLLGVTIALLAGSAASAHDLADDESAPRPEIVVTAAPDSPAIVNAPNTTVTVDAATIRTRVNALSVEDAIRYVPGLIVRKRHVGDNFAPIATRTSGLGSSARSLIYADGILLSALIANNNGAGSPKWQLVSPHEVARIDVLYGPFSAAYSGSSIGTVVTITTRMPDRLEANLDLVGNLQRHEQYNTARTLGTGQFAASLGDRSGRFAYFASVTHTLSNGQPVAYVTAPAAPPGTTGAIATVNRLGMPIEVLGAGDIDHHVQDTLKLKLTYDLTDAIRASYTAGLFFDRTRAGVDSYLRDAAGRPVYTSGFNSGFYRRANRHWAHALTLDGNGPMVDWQVVGSLYHYARDQQATPNGLLPASATGGAGTVQDQSGTGWVTLDARASWRSGGRDRTGLDRHVLSLGGHVDRYTLQSQSYASPNWFDYATAARTAASLGKTRTAALWLQHQARLAPGVALTLGARHEWWRAFDGFNQVPTLATGIVQPSRTAQGFSPKASLEWRSGTGWTARLSAGQAWRFPTVGELYAATTVGTVLLNPNPGLRPERARSAELALEHRSDRSSLRLSLFDEVIDEALVAQNGTLVVGSAPPVTTSFVQNVTRTRARGVELALDRREVLPGFDLAASVTYADAITSRNPALPASEGMRLPSVPRWKANAVATWHPVARLSLTAAARLSSRNYATLENNDVVADTYQGFDRFFVVDLRATYRVSDHVELALGVDNANNDRYFLFHPFPQRSLTAELHWTL